MFGKQYDLRNPEGPLVDGVENAGVSGFDDVCRQNSMRQWVPVGKNILLLRLRS